MPSGPFLAIAPGTFPGGFDHAPPGGLCLSAFLFLQRGDGRILLGKYAEHERWTALTGLDMGRVRRHASGWTIPASHLKVGEDPRDAALRVAREILQAQGGVRLGEPRVATEVYELDRLPGETHHDVLFLVDATLDEGAIVARPPWYAALEWLDPKELSASDYARGHEDVVRRWLA